MLTEIFLKLISYKVLVSPVKIATIIVNIVVLPTPFSEIHIAISFLKSRLQSYFPNNPSIFIDLSPDLLL